MTKPPLVTALLLALLRPALAAQAPRTAWGDPDLQGTYTSDNSIGVPFERPEPFGTRSRLTDDEYAERVKGNQEQLAKDLAARPRASSRRDPSAINASRHWLERPELPSRATSLIVDPPDGRVPPLTPDAQRRADAQQAAQKGRGLPASHLDFSNYDRCISRGVAGSIIPVIYGNGTSILQAPGVVVISHEMIHEARVVPLDGRAHAGAGVAMWMGDSRGHWDGDTLVVETTNFTDRTGIGGNGNGATHSQALRLVERFTRTDADTLRDEFTVHDPATYTQPWTVRFDLDTRPDYEIYEYACHEGNYGLANMLSAARASERPYRP